jgi:hypothetical protein
MSIRNPNSKFNLINNRIKYGTDGGINVDAGTLFVDASNSRVGIGTNAPAYPLDVSGSVNILGNLVVNGSPISPVSGPSYTFSGQNTFTGFNGNTIFSSPSSTYGFLVSGTAVGNNINLLIQTLSNINMVGGGANGGGIAFLCPTTLSNITGSINFGFNDQSANDISLSIFKNTIANAYINFDTNETTLSSSRFVYDTPSTNKQITYPINITGAGLTSNDIVYFGLKLNSRPPVGTNTTFLTLRYTLNFS